VQHALNKASRDHSLKVGPEFSLSLLRFAAIAATFAAVIRKIRATSAPVVCCAQRATGWRTGRPALDTRGPGRKLYAWLLLGVAWSVSSVNWPWEGTARTDGRNWNLRGSARRSLDRNAPARRPALKLRRRRALSRSPASGREWPRRAPRAALRGRTALRSRFRRPFSRRGSRPLASRPISAGRRDRLRPKRSVSALLACEGAVRFRESGWCSRMRRATFRGRASPRASTAGLERSHRQLIWESGDRDSHD